MHLNKQKYKTGQRDIKLSCPTERKGMIMKTLTTFAQCNTPWELNFVLGDAGSGTMVEAFAKDTAVLTISRDKMLCVEIITQWEQAAKNEEKISTLHFTLTSPNCSGVIRIIWYGFSFRLYVNGKLEDEEWPLGEPIGTQWDICASDAVSELAFSPAGTYEEDPETIYTEPFQNFVLPGHNTGVGDCMPFARDGRYCLYYLFDRRSHKSKHGLGAHQWAQISSADLRTWTIHPMAVGITEQWEGSICTGSLIQKDGITYAFYAVRMSDGSPARLTWAVSKDGVHFDKTGKYFALTKPYEPVSARDPMVFWGADGQYHMLVTTSLVQEGAFGGCLAHLTSTDLEEWTQHEPFIVPGYSDQPECSDYFEWNGWYYLVFSNFAIARYRMSRSPFGPWIRPENDLLDALEVQVPKTAAFGDRRFSTGFLARRPREYAGNAVTHELFQRPDGTLGIRQLEEILPTARESFHPENILLDAGQNRAAATLPAMKGDFRLKAALETGKANGLIGMLLTFNTEDKKGRRRSYRIEMDPAAGTVVIVRPGEDFERGCGRDLLRNVNLSGSIQIDLLVNNDILDLMLPDGRGMTMRLDDSACSGSSVEFYVIGDTLAISEICLLTM